MPQTVIVDRDGVVRVVDAGPPGPPGFGTRGGDDTPIEMLGVAQSRSLPWTSWTQFGGIPLHAMGVGPYKFTIGFATAPMTMAAISDMGMAPLHLNLDPENKRFGMAAFLLNISGDGSPPSEVVGSRMVVTGYILPSVGGDMEQRELLNVELPVITLSHAPTPDEFNAIVGAVTNAVSLNMELGEFLVGLQVDVKNEDGTPFDHPSWNIGVLRTSIWQGDLDVVPRIDVSSPYTFNGMGLPQVNGLKLVRRGVDIAATFAPQGLFFGHLVVNEETGQFEADGYNTLEAIVEDAEDPEDPSVVALRAGVLRSTNPPNHPQDVVRLSDVDLVRADWRFAAAELVSTGVMNPSDYPLAYVDISEDMTLTYTNEPSPRISFLVVRGVGETPATLTIRGDSQADVTITVAPGEVYHYTVRSTHMGSPTEDPEIAQVEVTGRKIVEAPEAVTPSGQLQYTAAQRSITDDELKLQSFTQAIEANDQVVHVPNPGAGRSSVVQLEVQNTSGSTKTLEFDCPTNHFAPAGGVVGGSTRRFWIVVTGGETEPSVDAVDI